MIETDTGGGVENKWNAWGSQVGGVHSAEDEVDGRPVVKKRRL